MVVWTCKYLLWVVGGWAGRWNVDGWVEWVFRWVDGNLGGWLAG